MLACCTDYQPQIDDMNSRLDDMRAAVGAYDSESAKMQQLVNALERVERAVAFFPVEKDGAVIGFMVQFEGAGMVTVYSQFRGVSVIKEEDRYYWAENGSPIEREGKKVEISSETVVPVFKVDDNLLKISFDGGDSWSEVGAFGKEVEVDAILNYEYAPKSFGITLGSQVGALSAEAPSCTVSFTLTGDTSGLKVYAIAPEGMTAKAQALSATGGTIEVSVISPEADSTVLVAVSDDKGAVVMAKLAVLVDRNSFIEPDTPEDPDEPEGPEDPEDPEGPEDPDEPENPEDPEDPDEPDVPDVPDEPVIPEFKLVVDYEDCEMRNNQKEYVDYYVRGAIGSVTLEIHTKGSWEYEHVARTDTTGYLKVWCEGAISRDAIVLTACDAAGHRDTAEVRYTDLLRKISIMGDSYSAYDGMSTVPYYPRNGNDVSSQKDMWWYKFTHRDGFKQEKVNAWSGSTICCTGYDGADFTGEAFCTQRAKALGHPDIVAICGATNDSWAGSPIGEYKYSYWTQLDLFNFRPALAYLFNTLYDTYGENLEIYFILNDHLSNSIDESVKTICEYYEVNLVELQGIEKRSDHPTKKGQQQIYDQLMDCFNKHSR